ncbi:MAG: phospholipid-binding lipoprotein MlaA [Halieaceae bacterium]|jgi:phospholipid-binding lipoprotein MlaA
MRVVSQSPLAGEAGRASCNDFSTRRMRASLSFLLVLMVSSLGVLPAQASTPDDPFEFINRPVFAVNNTLDRWALRPLAKGYDFVVPQVAQRGVGNFFSNLYDVTSSLNALLQWRLEGAAQSGGRFFVNSTLGVVGFFDMATRLGIRPYRTDFGQTLSLWGVPEGPYVMLPLFGPRTFRSGTATLVDTFTLSVPPYLNNRALRNTVWGMELVHTRARLLEADELMSGDRYIFVRDAYLQQRAAFVNDGEITDYFSDFDDGWDEAL